jgi:hypothetical protein
MRVRFQIGGGIGYFPGLAAPRTIDVDGLDERTRQALTNLVEEADFFNLPAHTPPHPGSADHQTYQITIEDAGRRHTVYVSDPVSPPPLQRLIELLRTAPSDKE